MHLVTRPRHMQPMSSAQSTPGYGSRLAQTCSAHVRSRVRSRLDRVPTTNERDHFLKGSWYGSFGLHQSATVVFGSAQTNNMNQSPIQPDYTGLKMPQRD